jgi:hypothetical protein
MPVEDVTIANSTLHTAEHGLAEWTHADIPERAEQYPEARMFGRLPASAIYVRHANAIRICNTELRADEPEARPAIVTDDVHDLELRALTTTASSEIAIALHNTTDALIQGTRLTAQAASLVRVTGPSSARIVLSANDLSRVATPTQVSDGASPQAVTSL